ncbi:MAG: DNA cytosine methyltransferase [Methanoregula sp.]|jgi:DNA (cytosine-5)-methyltransferase 1|uniref:DNA cytosine methyltransferase n=1 Tax=Methanoregula sp. TaxID=2052170 RepID=UPI003C13CABE
MSSDFLVLDMFSGGGGLTEGFIRRSFDFLGHIEMDRNAADTLETRLLYHELKKTDDGEIYDQYYRGTLDQQRFFQECKEAGVVSSPVINKELSVSTNHAIIRDLQKRLKKEYHRSNVDVIIGGPPCQSFSLAGRGKNKERSQTDPRNYLYRHYLRFLKEFQPKLFVFENVPGLITAKDGTILNNVITGCSRIGYHLDETPHLLNASDFGVLQDRERIVFIGWKKENKDLQYPDFSKNAPAGKIKDLFMDLPELQAGEGMDEFQRYNLGQPSRYLIEKKIRNDIIGGIRHHCARMHNERDREIYRIAIKKWNESGHRLNYNELPEKLKTHRNRHSFVDRFKVVDNNSVSHAVLAHLAKDGHYFIHPDIEQARSLTVREAARIQSFPDDYLFEGPRSAKYVQIGNAVPPLMAEGIAGKIEEMLNEI